MVMMMSPIVMCSTPSAGDEGGEGVVWVRAGEEAPFSGYLLSKRAGARQVARGRLLEAQLELKAGLLDEAIALAQSVAKSLKACEVQYEAMRGLEVRVEPPARGEGLVWGLWGLAGGVVVGGVVGALLAR
jgi:hypothetical protein